MKRINVAGVAPLLAALLWSLVLLLLFLGKSKIVAMLDLHRPTHRAAEFLLGASEVVLLVFSVLFYALIFFP